MKIYLIQDVKEWKEIREEWNDLIFDSMEFFNPFLSFEWLFSWWEVFGEGRSLCILIARNDGELIGIAPLMISRKIGFKVCEFIGTGRSDYLGFIISNENRGKIITYFFEFIINNLKWHLINLRDCTDSPQELLRVVKRVGLKGDSIVGDVSPRLIMNDSWEKYLAGKSSRNRGNIRRAIRKIEADKEVIVKCERDYSPHLIDELANVEAHSWKVETGEPRYSGKGKIFFRNFFERFSRNGWLEVWTLRYRETLLVYSINFAIDKAIYNYNVSFDKDYKKYVQHHSVGSVLLSIVLRDSFQRKQKVYDFLRGDEPYKKLWVNDVKELPYIAIYKKHPLSFLSFILHFKLRLYLRDNKMVKRFTDYFRKG